MTRRTTSASAVRAAVRSAVALETLELRRLLSYDLAGTYIDTDDGGAYKDFGRSNVAISGNLALIGSPGQTASYSTDGGNTWNDVDETDGQVTLMDTTTGQILQTFHNPISNPPTGQLFGTQVAFVDGKIAITAPGAVTTYIYDDYSDEIPDSQYTYGLDPFVSYGSTLAVHGDDLLVSVIQTNTPGSNGSIVRYDLDSPSTTHVAEYFNPDAGVAPNDQFGAALASDGEYIYVKGFIDDHSAVVIMDDNGDHVFTYDGLSGDAQFGMALATAEHPSAGNSVFISDPIAARVVQVDIAGNTLQTFNLPVENQINGVGAFSLAVNGDKLIAGNPSKLTLGEDTFLHQTGAAYVFDLATGALTDTIENPNQDDTLVENAQDEFDYFGLTVAALPNGGWLITAPFANNAYGVNAGTVYVYEPTVVGPTNSAPEDLAIAAATESVRQQSVDFSGSFIDPDAGDTHTVSWDFGDGNVIAAQSTANAGALTPSHVYTDSGTYTVTMTITDDSGELNAAASTTHQITVSDSAVVGQTLYLGGSNAVDNLVLVKDVSGATVVTFNGQTTTFTGNRIVFLGGSGNDTVDASKTINAALEAYGGAGNDTLRGGGIADILVGGADNDSITGGKGFDLIIGGTGNDTIQGDQENDILIAGSTVHDADSDALNGISDTWNSGGSYTSLVNTLRTTVLRPDIEVFDDGQVDRIIGGAGQDWMMFNDANDIIVDAKKDEIVTDLD